MFLRSVSLKINQQVSFVYDIEGNPINNIDKVREAGKYVCSSLRRFIPGNYGSFTETLSPGNYTALYDFDGFKR